MGPLSTWIGTRLGRWLSHERHQHEAAPVVSRAALADALSPGDVLLVDGITRISTAIKYLTQSTWSHAALYIGDDGAQAHQFIEADLVEGVRQVGLDTFAGRHCRICRPMGLSPEEIDALVAFARQRLGNRYDLRNVIDLARYLLPMPPLPVRWRRRMIALGSGDPTRAICSTLIAECFHSVRYPILPIVERRDDTRPDCPGCVAEILHIRHHSLFAPRDFDVSPYFFIVKPALAPGFDPHEVVWSDERP